MMSLFQLTKVSALLILATCGNGFVPYQHQHQSHHGGAAVSKSIEKKKNKKNNNNINNFPLRVSATESNIPATTVTTTTASPLFQAPNSFSRPMGKIASKITKLALMAYIVSMCITLPIALFPPYLLHKLGLISKLKQERLSLRAGEFTARNLLKLIPFCKIHTIPYHDPNPEPAIWVCNHVSMLDIFLLLAADKRLKGKNKRPIKIVYWKQLEDNPITKLLFQQSGFIPVQMTANKAGEANDYDMKSFKALLKSTKKAFEDGYDIGILPEGQLNPNPEGGLLPCFSGAFTLAKMSRRPIHMMALYGSHKLWHADENIGMTVTGRDVAIRAYPGGRRFTSSDEFLDTFNAVVGEFGSKGTDLPDSELNGWLDGTLWEEKQQQQKEG